MFSIWKTWSSLVELLSFCRWAADDVHSESIRNSALTVSQEVVKYLRDLPIKQLFMYCKYTNDITCENILCILCASVMSCTLFLRTCAWPYLSWVNRKTIGEKTIVLDQGLLR
jgi:hypothetical protein